MALWLSFLSGLNEEIYMNSTFAFQSIDNDSSGQLDQEEMMLAIEDLKIGV